MTPDDRIALAIQSPKIVVRFWARVEKSDGCWIWTGPVRRHGYGCLFVSGPPQSGQSRVVAHRFSWALAHNETPGNRFVCHTCDNPPCVRPDHLFIGTCADNNRDMARKGRLVTPIAGRRGEDHPRCGISEEVARSIKSMYRAGARLIEIHRATGVRYTTVESITSGRRWTHV